MGQLYSGILEINLSAVRHNWRTVSQLYSGQDCGAVVKANAYGLGYAPIVQALYSEGCRTFFVANYLEALEVQKLLEGKARIFVLQGCPRGLEKEFVRRKLIPVLISEAMLARWCAASESDAPCAIKVNTGMNRLGMSEAEFSLWIKDPLRWRMARPVLIMSHMACADTPEHPLNKLQLDRFVQLESLAKQYYPDARSSLANSAALFLGEQWHFDIARPGIALYGGREGIPEEIDLQPVATLSLPILQLRQLEAGEWVGYGGVFCAESPMTIAVASCGYADGLLRSLSNVAVGDFRGFSVPLLGRVSMDSCAFDLSAIPLEQMPVEGELIEMIGARSSLTLQAKRAGTISYELLTGLGERLQKRYIENN